MLDSVMVSAVSSGFSVEEFIHYVKTDTTFYQGFKNLRYYSHQFQSELEIFDRSNKSIGFLTRYGHYKVNDNRLVVKVESEKDDGKIYNRRGKYRYYTPEFFDYIFFPKDTLNVSKFKSNDDDIDSNVTVNVEMGYIQNQLIPLKIHYNGFWDTPFSKPEIADFKLLNYNFDINE